MAAGGLNMLASLPAACIAFLALSMLPSAVITAVSPYPFGDVISVTLVICAIFLALTARRNYIAFLDHLRLRLGIARLADDAETASRAKSAFLSQRRQRYHSESGGTGLKQLTTAERCRCSTGAA